MNCGSEFYGSYCNNCGQKDIKDKISLKTIFSDFLQVIFFIESPIINTARSLIVKPGVFVHSYLKGKRKPFLSPMQFFLFSVTIYLIAFNLIGDEYFKIINRSLYDTSSSKVGVIGLNTKIIQEHVRRNIDLFYFLQPLVFALFYRLLFSKSKTNYAESLIFAIYLVGIGLLISTIILFLMLIDVRFIIFRFIILFIFFSYAIVQFADVKSIVVYIKSFLVVLFSYILYGLIVASITVSYLLLK